jgi:hypothetical protein
MIISARLVRNTHNYNEMLPIKISKKGPPRKRPPTNKFHCFYFLKIVFPKKYQLSLSK